MTTISSVLPARESGLKAFAQRHPLTAYFVLAFALMWVFVIPIMLSQRGLAIIRLPEPLIEILLLVATFSGPLPAAFIMTTLVEGREGRRRLVQRMFQWRVGLGWYLLLLIGYPLIFLIGLSFYSGTAPWVALLQNWTLIFTFYLPAAVFGIIFPSLGEEPGWRGFALPRLQQQYGALIGTVILGVLHGLWHLPVYFIPGTILESRRLISSLALLIPLSSALAGAQVRAIDQGSFTITMNNQRIGREDFSIVEDASTQTVLIRAKGTVEYRERGLKLQPLLTANAAGASTEYEIAIRGGPIQKWTGEINRNRVRSYVSSERGQAAKEFVVSVGAMVLDDDVFHQYYFVAKRAGEGSIPVIIPQRNAQSTVTVARLGAEPIDIGNAQAEAQKLSVTEASGPTREVWVDSQGRVLRVAIPSRGIVAMRDELPANR